MKLLVVIKWRKVQLPLQSCRVECRRHILHRWPFMTLPSQGWHVWVHVRITVRYTCNEIFADTSRVRVLPVFTVRAAVRGSGRLSVSPQINQHQRKIRSCWELPLRHTRRGRKVSAQPNAHSSYTPSCGCFSMQHAGWPTSHEQRRAIGWAFVAAWTQGAEGNEMKVVECVRVRVRACVCVCVCMPLRICENSLLLNPSTSPSFFTMFLCVRACAWVAHTGFPGDRYLSWGGVQTHTEHKQFERLVIQTGVCSQTCRALFALQLCFVEDKKSRRVFCIYAQLHSLLLPSLCFSFIHVIVFLLTYAADHQEV